MGGGRPPVSADALPDSPADAGPGGDPPGPGPGSDRLPLAAAAARPGGEEGVLPVQRGARVPAV